MKPFNHSSDLDKITPALMLTQAEIPKIAKTEYNSFQKYYYAGLPDILNVVRPILQNHDFVCVQTVRQNTLYTRLIHSSGQWIENALPCVNEAKKGYSEMQATGTAITYARRYGIMMMLNFMAEDDTDGAPTDGAPTRNNARMKQPSRPADPHPSQAPKPAPQYSKPWLVNRARQLGYSNQDIADHVRAIAGETPWDELEIGDRQDIYNALKQKESGNA